MTAMSPSYKLLRPWLTWHGPFVPQRLLASSRPLFASDTVSHWESSRADFLLKSGLAGTPQCKGILVSITQFGLSERAAGGCYGSRFWDLGLGSFANQSFGLIPNLNQPEA